MKLDEAIARQEAKDKRRLEIRKAKGHDYAAEADCLTNFKCIAEIADILEKYNMRIPIEKPHGVAAWHMLHKYIRLLNLWNKDTPPKNEGLGDTHVDLENYSELAEECYEDYQRERNV